MMLWATESSWLSRVIVKSTPGGSVISLWLKSLALIVIVSRNGPTSRRIGPSPSAVASLANRLSPAPIAKPPTSSAPNSERVAPMLKRTEVSFVSRTTCMSNVCGEPATTSSGCWLIRSRIARSVSSNAARSSAVDHVVSTMTWEGPSSAVETLMRRSSKPGEARRSSCAFWIASMTPSSPTAASSCPSAMAKVMTCVRRAGARVCSSCSRAFWRMRPSS